MTQDASKQHAAEYQQAISNALDRGKCMLMVGYGPSSRVQPEANLDVPSNWGDILKGISSWCADRELIEASEQQDIDDAVNQANRKIKEAPNLETEDPSREDSSQVLITVYN